MVVKEKNPTIEQINIQLDVLFATDRQQYQNKYFELVGGTPMNFQLDSERRMETFTDPNFSSGAERVTQLLAGKDCHKTTVKHGIDGKETNSEAKPEKTNDKGKLKGRVSFADMSLEKIQQHYDTNVEVLSSGWVNGVCLYVIGIPMRNEVIKYRLIESFNHKKSKGVRKVLSFSRTQYQDADLELYWIHPDFESYKQNMVGPQYELVKSLQK